MRARARRAAGAVWLCCSWQRAGQQTVRAGPAGGAAGRGTLRPPAAEVCPPRPKGWGRVTQSEQARTRIFPAVCDSIGENQSMPPFSTPVARIPSARRDFWPTARDRPRKRSLQASTQVRRGLWKQSHKSRHCDIAARSRPRAPHDGGAGLQPAGAGQPPTSCVAGRVRGRKSAQAAQDCDFTTYPGTG